MIIFLSELQKEHLHLLHQHSTQVLVDFCKLTIDYLCNGMNQKKCAIAAEKLDISALVVQNLLHALAYLIVEACKHNLSETNFVSSLAIAGFSEDKQKVLLKLYNTKKGEISAALNLLQQKDPSYQDLSWRFEIQIASKMSHEEIVPMIAMDFVLTTPKNYGQYEKDYTQTSPKHINSVSKININSSIQDAKASSQCQQVINHVLLQSDMPNLLHLTNKLDEALKESKSQHVRKVQRSL
ncbi:COMM domain-containing protein 2-like [Pararge aegeria]|uniref:Jg10840 protein n=2 Tax=Pararge aegeria TaxID=116150 RepID=A0A8S4SEV0_9NEOP|nr:COMM domain-containing protein 2-like [Pararge aegeria]CAH2263053.1 jg10840 [Pararge aegeria aegeria]